MEPFGRIQVRAEAARLVVPLFKKALPRSDVLEIIQADTKLSEPLRQQALSLAESYPAPPSWPLPLETLKGWPRTNAPSSNRCRGRVEAACGRPSSAGSVGEKEGDSLSSSPLRLNNPYKRQDSSKRYSL